MLYRIAVNNFFFNSVDNVSVCEVTGLRDFYPCWSVSYLSFITRVHYNAYEDFVILRFVISRFCSKYFTVTFARLETIVRYTEDL